ncbi:MAG: ester cyclase [Thermomicrobiales bacterium]
MRRALPVVMALVCVLLALPADMHAPEGRAASSTPAASPVACVATTEDQNEATARRWHEEALNEGKLEVIDEIAAPDIVHRSVTFTDLTGPEGVKQNLRSALTSFPDLHYTIEDVITEGDRVVVRWRAEGTQDGVFQGIPPTGKHLTWTGINIYRMECGRIAEVWTEVDGVSRLRQLGVLPGPGTPIP